MADESRIYCWGASSCGQLGMLTSPGRADLTESAKLIEPTCHHLLTSNIVQVASGLEHTLFLTSEGEVLACGNGEVGQLGIMLPNSNKQIHSPGCVCARWCMIGAACFGLPRFGQRTLKTETPVQVASLRNLLVKSIAAGEQHSVAVTSYGEVYSWGDNTFGQTAISGEEGGIVPYPARVKALAHVVVTQIACGANHTLALTADGSVYGWGLNTNGQLGMLTAEPVHRPQLLASLHGLPIAQLCCGGQMSACVSRCGYLITWGCNRHGQLGRTIVQQTAPSQCDGGGVMATSSATPKVVPHLASYSVPVVYVAAGTNHVAAQDAQGKLWTFGLGSCGELGHGGSGGPDCSLVNPRTVLEIVGSRVTQVECGRNHTLVVTTGQVYSFGDGGCGQLGVGEVPPPGFVTTPRPVLPNWRHTITPSRLADASVQTSGETDTSQEGSKMEVDDCGPPCTAPVHVKQIFCGGDSSFLVTTSQPSLCLDRTALPRCPLPPPVPADTPPLLAGAAAHQVAAAPVPLPPPSSMLEEESQPPTCPHSSDPTPSPSAWLLPVYELQLKHLQYMVDLQPGHRVEEDLFSYLETAIGSVPCWNQSFQAPMGERVFEQHYIDLEAAEQYMEALAQIQRDTVNDMLLRGIEQAVKALPLKSITRECLRAFVLLPLTPYFDSPERYSSLHVPFARMLTMNTQRSVVWRWLSELPLRVLKKLVTRFVAVVRHTLKEATQQQSFVQRDVESVFELLKELHEANKNLDVGLAPEVFYVDEIFDKVQLSDDYRAWISKQHGKRIDLRNNLHFCNYPFLFNASCKTILLRIDSMMQMYDAMRSNPVPNMHLLGPFDLSMIPLLFGSALGALNPYLNLSIRRDHIIEDTLSELMSVTTLQLKLPLKVEFRGEEAQDEGGVRKEFFLLLMRELLKPDFGMFVEFEESRSIWFRENSYETEDMFMLVGLLCGLAIYNNVIVNLPFPLPLYKKLLQEPLTLEDFALLDPVMAQSLRNLLKYEGDDMEEVFCLNFSLDRSCFDQVVNKPLKEGGVDTPVTKENREEYVKLVVDYILTNGIKESFEAFRQGFDKVCGSDILRMFQPFELMALVVGNENYDWTEFRKNTTYKGVYYDTHETIEMFWSVFGELDLSEKKKFLLFLTGCDRVPLLGMKVIKMVVEPVSNSRLLPVAHTCVHQLDLPQYQTRERLRYKLLQAIQHCQGFGLV